MSKSSIDTFDPQGQMVREVQATSLTSKDAYSNRAFDPYITQVIKEKDNYKDSELGNSFRPQKSTNESKNSQSRQSIPLEKNYLRMMIMIDQTLAGSQQIFKPGRMSMQAAITEGAKTGSVGNN